MSTTPAKTPLAPVSASQTRRAPWVAVLLILVWIPVLPRIVPNSAYDRGIFVSVAERLLAGDRLYLDVWDNKDPLFFFSIALGRLVSPYADIVLELGWIACASAATFVLARWRGYNSAVSLLLALGATPVILTGYFYAPGYTHLPGIALTLGVLAATVSRRHGFAGALIALLFFMKIVMVPIAGLLLLGIIVGRRNWAAALPAAAGFSVVAAVVLGFLAGRGELQPYLHSLVMNVAYSQSELIDKRWGSFIGHLLRVASGRVILVAVGIGAAVAWSVWRHRKDRLAADPDTRSRMLWMSAALALTGAVVVLGFTGVWDHHAQVLYVAAILTCVGAVPWAQHAIGNRPGIAAVTVLAIALCLSGGASPAQYISSLASAPSSLSRLGDPSTVARKLSSASNEANYARVGQNDDGGHADGLGTWDLACPRFHQYPFDSAATLTEVSKCIPTADVIIVAPTAIPIDGQPRWNVFISNVNSTLREGYSCIPNGEGRICIRKTRNQ